MGGFGKRSLRHCWPEMPSGTSPTQPAWHLIAGSTGAGKTTYARGLGEATGAIVFSIDEWMTSLFWPDCPEKNDLAWALERVGRCEDQAAAMAAQLFGRRVSAVLDMGLTRASQRERWVARAQSAGCPVVLHVLDLPAQLRWERVEARNQSETETFAFQISREMFDLVETMWEPPTEAECSLYTEVIRQES